MPEQIAGRLKREEVTQISHETIYQMTYSDHAGVREWESELVALEKSHASIMGWEQKQEQI